MRKICRLDKLIEIFRQAEEERKTGIQVNISIMKKNKKFQKDQMAAEGYTEFVEFFNEMKGGSKMAESMQGLHRTCRCAEVTTQMVGSEVTLMGWVQKARDKGGIIFVDLRDRSGIMQLIFENGSIDEEGFAKAGKLRSEFVIAVTGTVEKRGGAVNENLATGEIEVRAKSLRVLSEAEVPPFPVEENSKTKEDDSSEIPLS